MLQLALIQWLGIQIRSACFRPGVSQMEVSARYDEDIQVPF
jgi:hypothetical protein